MAEDGRDRGGRQIGIPVVVAHLVRREPRVARWVVAGFDFCAVPTWPNGSHSSCSSKRSCGQAMSAIIATIPIHSQGVVGAAGLTSGTIVPR